MKNLYTFQWSGVYKAIRNLIGDNPIHSSDIKKVIVQLETGQAFHFQGAKFKLERDRKRFRIYRCEHYEHNP